MKDSKIKRIDLRELQTLNYLVNREIRREYGIGNPSGLVSFADIYKSCLEVENGI